MMSLCRTLVIATISAYSFQAFAQTMDGPTDHELYAAYCSGDLSSIISSDKAALNSNPDTLQTIIEEGKRNGLSKILGPSELLSWAKSAQVGRDAAREHLKTQVAEAEQKRSRFLAYLIATGVATDPKRPQASSGLLTAMKEGAADSTTCFAVIHTCMESYAKRIDESQSKIEKFLPTAEMTEQLNKCVSEDASCRKIQRCNQVDELPF